MKKNILCICCILLAGCVAIETKTVVVPSSAPAVAPVGKELTPIRSVHIGMTHDEVMAVMGTTVTIGYEKGAEAGDPFKPITLKNPYRVEQLTVNNTTYEVVYFFTSVQKPDGVISEEELTPLIFQNKKLVGKGREYLATLEK